MAKDQVGLEMNKSDETNALWVQVHVVYTYLDAACSIANIVIETEKIILPVNQDKTNIRIIRFKQTQCFSINIKLIIAYLEYTLQIT